MTVWLCPTERMAPLDLVSALIADGLLCRQDRLPEHRIKLARFRDADRTLDRFDYVQRRAM